MGGTGNVWHHSVPGQRASSRQSTHSLASRWPCCRKAESGKLWHTRKRNEADALEVYVIRSAHVEKHNTRPTHLPCVPTQHRTHNSLHYHLNYMLSSYRLNAQVHTRHKTLTPQNTISTQCLDRTNAIQTHCINSVQFKMKDTQHTQTHTHMHTHMHTHTHTRTHTHTHAHTCTHTHTHTHTRIHSDSRYNRHTCTQ